MPRGGARPGAGRPKSGKPSKTVVVRVDRQYVDLVENLPEIMACIDKWELQLANVKGLPPEWQLVQQLLADLRSTTRKQSS